MEENLTIAEDRNITDTEESPIEDTWNEYHDENQNISVQNRHSWSQ
jgi:hypothetical protein